MQDSVGCDYFRTSVIFRVSEIFVFVGAMRNIEMILLLQIFLPHIILFKRGRNKHKTPCKQGIYIFPKLILVLFNQ